MKNQLKTALLLVCSLALISGSCQKAKTSLTDLPAPTQEGKNTFGCVINGKAFIAQANFSQLGVQCSYGYIESDVSKGHYFRLSGANPYSKKDETSGIRIGTTKINIQEGTVYQLQNQQDNGAFAQRIINNDTYTSTTGELKITKFDEANKIASGTFWFNAENDKGEKVEVKDGRFDVTFL